MPFSAGVYSLPTPALVPGQTVASTENNTSRNDFATALNLTMLRNGTSTATANLPMGGYKLTGLGVATTLGDALSYNQAAVVSDLTAAGTVTISSGTANGVAYLNGSKVLTSGSALTFDGTNFSTTGALQSKNSNYKLKFFDASGSTGYGYIWTDGTTGWQIDTQAAQPMQFLVNGYEGMRLTSTGLGIGTSSPYSKLTLAWSSSTGINSGLFGQVTNAAGANNGYRIGLKTQSSNDNWSAIDQAFLNLGVNAETYIAFSTTNGSNTLAEKMRLDGSGNLGLGVTPSAYTGLVAAQVGAGSIVSSKNTNNALFSSNWYSDGTDRYLLSGYLATQYQQYAGQHRWYTAPSGTAGNPITFTQAMTLDASGNLGIGTSSPAAKLNVATGRTLLTANNEPYALGVGYNAAAIGGFIGAAAVDTMVFSSSGGAERMRIDSSGNVGIGTSSPTDSQSFTKALDVNGTSGAAVYVRTAGSATNYAYIGSYGADGYAANRGSGSFIFANGGSERMRIDSSGNLLVGTTGTPNGTSVYGLGFIPVANGRTQIRSASNITTAADLVAFYNPNGLVGTITTSGSATSYVTSSDYRLKENIQPMQGALDVVAQLNPVTYTWKADGSDGQGFIAHELQAVVPDCVTGEKDAVDAEGNPVYQGIDTSFLVATLCKAIQELEARVKQLEGK